MKLSLTICGCIAIASLVSCTNKVQETNKVKTVRTATVTSAAMQTVVQYPGKIKAADDANLSFKVAGRIQQFLVHDGGYVQKGQVIVELDPSDYNLQLKAIEAEYTQVKADCERIIALFADSATTKSNYDKAVSGLEQISAKLQNARNQVSYTKITAPYDGYIQKHFMEENEIVSAGLPVVSMMSSKAMEVEIYLPASEYVKRDDFKGFNCTFDVFPGKVYDLRLINITPKANTNQLYPVRLQLNVAAGQPMPSVGMNTMVNVSTRVEETNELLVPSSAVCNYQNETYVYAIDDNKASKRNVTIMRLKNNGTSVISSSELKDGDIVIASGVHHIDNGDDVKILDKPSSANVGNML